jgi:transposase
VRSLERPPLSIFEFATQSFEGSFWDTTGLWVCAKKLEKGRFHWPKAGSTQGKIVLSHEEFAMLLGGIDLAQTQRRRWYRKPVVEESGSSQIPA